MCMKKHNYAMCMPQIHDPGVDFVVVNVQVHMPNVGNISDAYQ